MSYGTLSLPREKCMKCLEENDILMSPYGVIRRCSHKICQSCFRKENIRLVATKTINPAFKCPCCHTIFYNNTQSIDEAILVCKGTTLSNYISPLLYQPTSTKVNAEIMRINAVACLLVETFEAALQLNSTNFHTLYSIFRTCCNGRTFLGRHNKIFVDNFPTDFYRLRLYNYSFKLLDHPAIPEGYECVRSYCCDELANFFDMYNNTPAALKYSKLAYEYCLRSSDHTELAAVKDKYFKRRGDFDKLPPLRFAVGDDVEFLHELETGSEWKLGKVLELRFADRSFDASFSSPYRLQLLDDSYSADQPAVYAWVKADTDRYVRKVGVRSIEDTRYQARLEAKVDELAHVYCSEEFVDDIYLTLAQDREFVDMLRSVWQIELSEALLHLYRLLVMYRQPLVRTDSGYHVPSSEEVIAGIRAYFNTAHLSSDATLTAPGEDSYTTEIRNHIISIFQGSPSLWTTDLHRGEIQGLLLRGIKEYINMLSDTPNKYSVGLNFRGFSVSSELSEALAKVSTARDLANIVSKTCTVHGTSSELEAFAGPRQLHDYLCTWICIYSCLERAGPACECAYVYFFVKFCLDRNLGVPKLALALYDRMNMQLSREFIRCANPTCKLNKLDKSTGHVKFKKCSRCQAVIYCSRDCQVAHYPDHKRLCREHSTG